MNHTTSFGPTTRAATIRMIVGGTALLLAGGVLFASDRLGAASGDSATYVPITPCRLFDTRPAPDNVGPRIKPVGPGEAFQVQATGSNGNCTIPAGATAIAINATAVDATAPSWAAFYPAGAERPLASSLNYVPGAAATPNSIDVRLSDDGRFEVFNKFGSVHLLGDVSGYYTGDVLDRLSDEIDAKADASAVYTKAQVDALLAALTPSSGYSDAEIDDAIAAAVAGKANVSDVYTKSETDGAIAAAVAGKADSHDVYPKSVVYTKVELDAMHNHLYTKDEVDELLVADKVWTAAVAADGSKLKDGPYTTTYFGVGQYRVSFQLAPFAIPAAAEPVVVAQARCPGMPALFAKLPIVVGGNLAQLNVDVFTFDPAGALTDCPIDVMLRLD